VFFQTVTGGARTLSTKIGEGRVGLVWGHGLGSTDPGLRTRFNDGASQVVFSAMADAGLSCVCYDARGHGASKGWEENAQKDEMQFSWPRLGEDMLKVNLFLPFQTHFRWWTIRVERLQWEEAAWVPHLHFSLLYKHLIRCLV